MKKTNKRLDHSGNAENDKLIKTTQFMQNAQNSQKLASQFIRLLSDFTVGSVKAKIAGELKNHTDEGSFICYFETTGELYSWTYGELRAIIRKK